ncbi:Tectonic-1 [Symbiodinium microadriaticum]|uniref:Tectonic-1 n=1 Tax=Symbiodinium microadriaticum TaxID=2951 RepID=A0A1Q9DPR5_SYMMI|nr:Tectonic-1 [Symbiodinium microadriaticum]
MDLEAPMGDIRHAAMRCRAWLQSLGWLTLASAAPSVDINDPVNLGTCTCDLTEGQCDVNCCCDPDCSGLSGLTGSFSCLPEGPVNANAQYCYSKSWLHSVNPRVDLWVIADDLRGLLCVSVDNSAVRGEVFQNEATLSSSQIDAVIQERQRSSSTGTAADEQVLRGYRAGDVLKIHSALSAAGEVLAVTGPSTLEAAGNMEVVSSLRLPTADPLGTCAAPGQAVRFLNDVPAAGCSRNVDLATTCTQLGARSRLESFMLRSQYMPEDMRCGSRCLLPEIVAPCPAGSANGSASTQCTGNALPLEDPVFSGGADSCSCKGVLKDVHYNFTFGFDETQQVVRITNMAVSFTLQDVVSQGCQVVSLQQGGSVHFFQEQSDGSQPEARSGNPGYQNGLPLLVSQCLDFDGSGTCSSYGPRVEATVPGITMAGTCRRVNSSAAEQDDARVPINFGENSMSGCTLSLTRADLAALCRAGADAATGFTGLLAMLPFGRSGNRWTQIAAFGSVPTSAQDPADWVQVEELTSRHVQQWLVAYMENYQKPPEHAQQLCAFARHRGAHLMYRVVRDAMLGLTTESAQSTNARSDGREFDGDPGGGHGDVATKGGDAWKPWLPIPVLRRLRSEIKGTNSDSRDSIRMTRRAQSVPRSYRGVSSEGRTESQPLVQPRLSTHILTKAYQAAAKQLQAHEAAVRARESIERFGKNLDHSSPELTVQSTSCMICFENTECVRSAGQLCVDRGCEGWFCSCCLAQYFENIIQETPFAVPTLRCPGCKGFVPPSCWQEHVAKAETVEKWHQNAANLLSLRCGACDEPGSLLLPGVKADDSREGVAREAFGTQDPTAAAELEQSWCQYERGEMSAASLLDVLLSVWHPGYEDQADGNGFAPGKFWDRFSAAANLIEDAGLRAVLQLSVLKRFPKTATLCCNEPHCFKCKVTTHHEGMSCEEVLAQQSEVEDGVQFCPSCGVATMKSEGCNHMICLCGEDWTWDGPED